jgi:hypothetical protein
VGCGGSPNRALLKRDKGSIYAFGALEQLLEQRNEMSMIRAQARSVEAGSLREELRLGATRRFSNTTARPHHLAANLLGTAMAI